MILWNHSHNQKHTIAEKDGEMFHIDRLGNRIYNHGFDYIELTPVGYVANTGNRVAIIDERGDIIHYVGNINTPGTIAKNVSVDIMKFEFTLPFGTMPVTVGIVGKCLFRIFKDGSFMPMVNVKINSNTTSYPWFDMFKLDDTVYIITKDMKHVYDVSSMFNIPRLGMVKSLNILLDIKSGKFTEVDTI